MDTDIVPSDYPAKGTPKDSTLGPHYLTAPQAKPVTPPKKADTMNNLLYCSTPPSNGLAPVLEIHFDQQRRRNAIIQSSNEFQNMIASIQQSNFQVQQTIRRQPGLGSMVSDSIVKELTNWSQKLTHVSTEMQNRLADAILEKQDLERVHKRCAEFAARTKIDEHVQGNDIKHLQEDKQALQAQIKSLEEAIEGHRGKINHMSSEMAELFEKIAAVTQLYHNSEAEKAKMAGHMKDLQAIVDNKKTLWMEIRDPIQRLAKIERLIHVHEQLSEKEGRNGDAPENDEASRIKNELVTLYVKQKEAKAQDVAATTTSLDSKLTALNLTAGSGPSNYPGPSNNRNDIFRTGSPIQGDMVGSRDLRPTPSPYDLESSYVSGPSYPGGRPGSSLSLHRQNSSRSFTPASSNAFHGHQAPPQFASRGYSRGRGSGFNPSAPDYRPQSSHYGPHPTMSSMPPRDFQAPMASPQQPAPFNGYSSANNNNSLVPYSQSRDGYHGNNRFGNGQFGGQPGGSLFTPQRNNNWIAPRSHRPCAPSQGNILFGSRSNNSYTMSFSPPGIPPAVGALPSPSVFFSNNPVAKGPLMIDERDIGGFKELYDYLLDTLAGFSLHHAAEVHAKYIRRVQASEVWGAVLNLYRPLNREEAWRFLEYDLLDGQAVRRKVTERLLLEFIVSRILVPAAWATFSPATDDVLNRLIFEYSRLEANSRRRDPTEMQLLTDQLATVVNSIATSSLYTAFREERITFFVEQMERIARPLMDDVTNEGLAMSGLRGIAEQAWVISARTLTSRLTFRYQFCDTGSRFASASMECAIGGGNGAERQAQHYRVRLCVSPVITARNDTGNSIAVFSVAKAQVIEMR